MLYLLSDTIVDDEDTRHEILKIGYSEKKFSDSREKSYNTCNYGYRLVHEIDGTRDDESRLHKKYKELLLPGSKEWFEYSDDIVEEFYPGFNPEVDTLESISPITMVRLEKNYLNDIVNPDYLLGTIESIYQRIERTIEATRYIWKRLLSGENVEDIENYIAEKIKRTESLLRSYNDTRDVTDKKSPGCSTTLAKNLRSYQDLYPNDNYLSITGEDPNYEVKFNTGRLKIDQLALEAYRKELEKRKS